MGYAVKPRVKRYDLPDYGAVWVRSLLLSEIGELERETDQERVIRRTVALALVNDQGGAAFTGPDDVSLGDLPLDFLVLVAAKVSNQNLGIDEAKKN